MPNDNVLTDDLRQRCRELLELSERGESSQVALRALADTYHPDISAHDRRSMAKSQTQIEAMRALLATPQPEPRAEVTSVQWWLAELDQHGNPKLSDGAHSERAGADKAMYLIKNLGLDNKGKRWAVARVELSEPRPSADGVNHDAVSAVRAMVDAARTGASS